MTLSGEPWSSQRQPTCLRCNPVVLRCEQFLIVAGSTCCVFLALRILHLIVAYLIARTLANYFVKF